MKVTVKIVGQSSNGIRLENIWCFHWNLTIATKLINEIWSTQLLIWIGTLFLNMLSRTYNVLIKLEQVESSVRDTMGIVGCFFCLYIIIYFCHLTSSQVILIIILKNISNYFQFDMMRVDIYFRQTKV